MLLKFIFPLLLHLALITSDIFAHSNFQKLDSLENDSTKTKIKVKKYASLAKLRMYQDSYSFDETAYTQGKGNIYLGSSLITFQKFSFGINDRMDFTIDGSIGGAAGIGVKYNFIKKLNFSFSTKSNYTNIFSGDYHFWRNQFIATIGNTDINLSLSYLNLIINSYDEGYSEFLRYHILTINGKVKIKERVYIQFEYFLPNNSFSFTTLGVSLERSFWKLNLGFMFARFKDDIWENYFFNFPYFSFQIPLRSNKITTSKW